MKKNLLRGSLSKFLVQPFLDENSKENANVDLNSYPSTSDANFSEKENARTDSNYTISPLPFFYEARDGDINIESVSGDLIINDIQYEADCSFDPDPAVWKKSNRSNARNFFSQYPTT